MNFFSRLLIISFLMLFTLSCTKDDGERIKPELNIVTITTGDFADPNGQYGITFSGLSGEDIASEIGAFAMGYNDDTVIQFNRVGEALSVKLFNIPDNCFEKGTTTPVDTLFIGIITGTSQEVIFELECL